MTVERAASIGCTVEEIAAILGIARSTLFERKADDPAIEDAIEKGRETGRATFRRLQWDRAQQGSDTMLIWLGKQMLGQRTMLPWRLLFRARKVARWRARA